MALTEKSDFYVAVHEDGINRVLRHIRRQRPSLFNYSTALIRANPGLLCEPIETTPEVTEPITVQPPIPLFGASGFALNYCFQLTDLAVEFHPGNVITLPPELNPPLGGQRFAFQARGCGGIGCPSKNDLPLFEGLFELERFKLKRLSSPGGSSGVTQPDLSRTARIASTAGLPAGAEASVTNLVPGGPFGTGTVLEVPTTHVFPTRKLSCFCLDLFATGRSNITGSEGNQRLDIKLDNFEIVDLQPEGLENSLECYLLLVVNKVILPEVNDAVSNVLFRVIELGELGSLQFSASTAVPNNPAIEENQLKSFINLEKFELQVPPIVVKAGDGEGGGGEGGPEITKTERARSRTGPSHLTAGISKDAFLRIFEAIRDNTTFDIRVEPRTIIDTALGSVKAGGHIKFHLDSGSVRFRNDNTVEIDELEIKWDKLRLDLALDLAKWCTPKICVPLLGCTPQWCVFEDDPDLTLPLNVPTVFTSEVSLRVRPKVYYGVGPPNKWIIHLDPIGPVDIDLVAIAETVGDILDTALEGLADALGLPDVVEELLGSVVDLIRDLLDIGDDAGEWLRELVFDTLGISVGIADLLADFLADRFPIFELEDPVEVLRAEGPLIPVKIPIEFIGGRVE
jgi:hypothetical protein